MHLVATIGLTPSIQTMSKLLRGLAAGYGAKKLGGGCFLIIPMLIGFIAGMATGNAYRGVLIGTGIGIQLAVGIWLLTKRLGHK